MFAEGEEFIVSAPFRFMWVSTFFAAGKRRPTLGGKMKKMDTVFKKKKKKEKKKETIEKRNFSSQLWKRLQKKRKEGKL